MLYKNRKKYECKIKDSSSIRLYKVYKTGSGSEENKSDKEGPNRKMKQEDLTQGYVKDPARFPRHC